MDAPLFIGIDVGTTKVCTLVAEMDGDDGLKIIGAGVEPSHGMRKGVVVDMEEASRAIAASVEKAERTGGYEIRQAFVSLAGQHISSVNSRGIVGVSGHTIEQDDVERALDAAQAIAIPHNREVIHVIPRGFTIDGQDGIRHPIGMHGFRVEVETHIITAATTSVDNISKCVEASGVLVEGFVLNPLASAEVVLTDTEKEMGVVVCDIGGGTTDLALYIDGNVWHTMVLAVGGNHITSDIAHLLRLPADVAEGVKIDHGHCLPREVNPGETFVVRPFGEDRPQQLSKADLAGIIEARVEETFTLMLQEIKRSGYDGLLPAGVVLTGGSSKLPGMRQLASDVLNLPVRIAGPQNLRGLVDQLERPEYSTSVGLLDWAVRESMDFNVRRRGSRKSRPGSANGRRPHPPVPSGVVKGVDWFKRLLP
ncbi:MAG: cell division protein FtsA [Chloroflexi bacterium]|nr:cell division protein FtsA [Chloroflexota bacterium]